jgi:hypothetical protein
MSDFSNLLEKIHDRRIRAGYREPRPPRERMPPDYIERCVRYPTVALIGFVAAIGAVLLFVILLILAAVMASAVSKPAAPAKVAPRRVAISKSSVPMQLKQSAGFASLDRAQRLA